MSLSPSPEQKRFQEAGPAAEQDDLLWQQLKSVPAFRALLRAVESRFYRGVHLAAPTLDVGCGDGHFAEMTFDKRLTAGIDPWWGPLQLARQSEMYDLLTQATGDRLPFPDDSFGSAFSNSVLEHIPDLPPVLKEVNRVLQMDGRFLITAPSHLFNEYLGGTAFLRKLGMPGSAERYQMLVNKITRHIHTETPQWWATQLAAAGFTIEQWQYYFSPEATRALEWGHVQGLPAAIMRALTGHWIIAPWRSSLRRTEQWLRPFYEEPFAAEGAYLLIIARKSAAHPLPAQLPPARPFHLEELQSAAPAQSPPLPVAPGEPIAAQTAPAEIEPSSPLPPPPAVTSAVRTARRQLLPPLLLLSSLLMAIVGQTVMGDAAAEQAAGLLWFGFSSIPLLILAWHRRSTRTGRMAISLPTWGKIPRRRWLIFPAVLLTSLAGSVNSGALLLWAVGIGAAVFALADRSQPGGLLPRRPPSRLLFTGLFLFLSALLLRLFNLSRLPFVLNGIEASLGLDVTRIIAGQVNNPFSTGWLTNPLLPLYFNAVPVRLLGQNPLAMRLISPFIGAATVMALFFIARRLWGDGTALLAATLLAGSHFHLHFSRMGMTNIWDPLLILLALGLVLIAWQQPPNAPQQRSLWLAAGFFTGLNVIGFTSSRLLPIMLLVLLLLALLFDRTTLRKQAPHLPAALLLAFITALPMILYYRGNPNLFMERANALGIFSGQTGWLQAQADRSGQEIATVFWQQVRTALLSFNFSRDASPVYRPLVPLLSFGPSILFVLGAIMAFIRGRTLKYAATLVWPAVTVIFAGAFLIEVPQSHRLVSASPALALLAAIALTEIGQTAWTAIHPAHPLLRRPLPLLILLALLFALNDVTFYFLRYPAQHQYADTNTETAAVLAEYLHELDDPWTVYFHGPPVMFTDFPTFPFLAPRYQSGINFIDVPPAEEPAAEMGGGLIFIFLPSRLEEMTAVQTRFPGGTVKQVGGYYADPLFTIYELPP